MLIGSNEYVIKKTVKELKHFEQTVEEIKRLARTYYFDLLRPRQNGEKALVDLTPHELFYFVRDDCKYVSDPKGVEHVSRPMISLWKRNKDFPFDCDDRTILSIAYFVANNVLNQLRGGKSIYEVRIIVAGQEDRAHHVYVEYRAHGGDWIVFDPTYPWSEFNKRLFVEGFRREYSV